MLHLNSILFTFLTVPVIIFFSSCKKEEPSADFEIVIDSTIERKFKVVNRSENTAGFKWTVGLKSEENLGSSSNLLRSYDMNPEFTVPKKGEYFVQLNAGGKTDQISAKKYIIIPGLPTSVTILGTEVTKITSYTDENGYGPDLFLHVEFVSSPTAYSKDYVKYDLVASQLPLLLTTPTLFESTNISSDYSGRIRIYITDFDAYYPSSGYVYGDNLITYELSPYQYYIGSEPVSQRFPKEIKLKNSRIEATLKLQWN